MKHFCTIFLFLIFTTGSATEYLVASDNLHDIKFEFAVIKQIENHYILLADDNDLGRLKQRGLTYRILDTDPRKSDFYAVYIVGDNSCRPVQYLYTDQALFNRYGDVLDTYEYCFIMRGNAERIQQVPGYNVKVDFLELSPVRYASKRLSQPLRSRTAPDPLIEDMIAAVSKDTCEHLLRQLTGRIPVSIDESGDTVSMYSRYCGNEETNKGILVPWLKKKFLEYGCDSVYELPLLTSKYDAPAVVGIKLGTKNPTLEKFCVIGGHPDNVLNSGDNMGRIYGANDNASGIVGPLETCRVMKDYTFENTILFCGFNAEERGLYGSAALAKYWRDNDFEVIGGIIAYDMIGCAPEGGYRVSFTYSEEVPGSEEFGQRIEEIADIYNTYEVRVSGTTGSVPTDCSSFWDEDYISVGSFASSGSPSIHTLGDSIGTWLNFDHLAKVTQTGLSIIADYAVPIEQTGIKKNTLQQINKNGFSIHSATAKQIVISFNDEKSITPMTLNIRNVSGRLVTTLPLIRTEKDRYAATWNGSNINGNPVARGLYILECKTDTESLFDKVLVMK